MIKHALSVFFACISCQSFADSAVKQVESITIEGTHIKSKLLLSGISSIKISQEEIEALTTNSIADILRGQAGIDISQQGGAGGLTFLSIRGGDPNFVVILIDGVKVNDPTNSRGGAFDLASIDPTLIESIDVFYGGFSSVYGTDALSGVLSIKTKKYQKGKLGSASLTISDDKSVGASLNLALPLFDIANMSINASLQEGDNSTFTDDFSRKQLITSIQSTSNSPTQWQLGTFFSQGDGLSFPEDSGGDRLAVIRTPEQKEFIQNNIKADLQHQLNSDLSFSLSSAWSNREEDINNPGIASGVLDGVPAIESNSDYDRFDLTATANYNVVDNTTLALGFAWSDENGEMLSVIDFGAPVPADYTLKRQTRSAFAEVAIKASEQLNIMLGARHDKTDKLQANTHKIIVNYQINESLLLSGHIGQGFKLPSFFALGHPFVGNSLLQPEESENIEFSLQKDVFDNGNFRLSIYQNTYSNLVDFDPIAFTNVNRAKIRAKGAEAQFSLPLSDTLNFNTQITHTKLTTFDSDVTLRRRPEWKGSATINYTPTQALSFTTRFLINDGYYDSSIPTGLLELDSFTQLDLSANYSFNNKTKARFVLQNALNSDHEEGVGFSNLGRQLSANISTSF